MKNIDDKKSIYEKYSVEQIYKIYNTKLYVIAFLYYLILVALGIYTIINHQSIILFYGEVILLFISLRIILVILQSNINNIVLIDCDPVKRIELAKLYYEKNERRKDNKRKTKNKNIICVTIAQCYSIIKNQDDNVNAYLNKIDKNKAVLIVKLFTINSKINVACFGKNKEAYEAAKNEYFEICRKSKVPKRISKQFKELFERNDLVFSGEYEKAIELIKDRFENAKCKQERVASAISLCELYKIVGKREELDTYKQYIEKYGSKYIDV